jgi:hypothetical protein
MKRESDNSYYSEEEDDNGDIYDPYTSISKLFYSEEGSKRAKTKNGFTRWGKRKSNKEQEEEEKGKDKTIEKRRRKYDNNNNNNNISNNNLSSKLVFSYEKLKDIVESKGDLDMLTKIIRNVYVKRLKYKLYNTIIQISESKQTYILSFIFENEIEFSWNDMKKIQNLCGEKLEDIIIKTTSLDPVDVEEHKINVLAQITIKTKVTK